MKNKIQKKSMLQRPQRRGFTLIEVLVVSTIIVVVAAIGLVSYSGAQVGARDAKRKQDLDTVRTTLLLFRSENGYYPIASLDPQNRVAFSFPRRIIARLGAAFRAPTVRAAISPDPVEGEETPAPTPLFTTAPPSTATPTPIPPINEDDRPLPSPTITPDGETLPGPALAYQEMSATLVEEGYLNEALPLDPVNDSTYYYGYGSDGIEFSLTSRLEKDGSVITLTN